jgi:membrane fusion protein, multidrug efflux system
MHRSRFLLSALALLTLAACRRAESPRPSGASGPPVAVRTAPVAAEELPVAVEAPATIRPAERASIAAKLTGTVASFPHGLGAVVAADDVLLTLAVPEVEARVRQAQAQLAEAARNADRARTLVSNGVSPADALRDAEDRLRFAQAAAAEAEALLAYATVRAPFAGVVTAKHVLPGDLATPGLPLLDLESTQRLRAEGALPERVAASLRPGDPVSVLLDDGTPLAARVEEISAAADAVSRSTLVKAALPPGSARSGQFARLVVPHGTSPALLVPASALTRFGQMERIFVVTDGRAQLRLVRAGRSHGDRLEILAGLRPDETVILDPPAALREGQPVTMSP